VNKPRRLGRGLEALLGQIPSPKRPTLNSADQGNGPAPAEVHGSAAAPPQGDPHGPAPTAELRHPPTAPPQSQGQPRPQVQSPSESTPREPTVLPVELIDRNPHQPRKDFDPAEIRALSESLSKHGLLQPVLVRRHGERFQLVAGERRLRAAQDGGWTEVPVKVVEADDRTTAELAIIENLQRKDLNPLEKAASFQRYLEQYGATQEELAGRLDVDRSTIANLIRLLELPEPVRAALRQGRVSAGHARALLPLGDEVEQIRFCERIEREGLNVRQTESIVQESIRAADTEPLGIVGRDGKSSRAVTPSEHVLALEQELKAALGMKVKLTHNARGRGKLVVHFRNHTEFERLRRQITEPVRGDVQSEAG